MVELLVYASIFVITAGLLTAILTNVTRVNNKQAASTEVAQQLNFVLNTVQNLVNDASLIESVYEGFGDEGITCEQYCTIKLRMSDDSLDPTYVFSDYAGVYLVQGENATSTLTNNRVKVDKFNLTKFEFEGGHASVRLDVAFTYNSENQQRGVTRSLQSAFGRAGAANFDSDLIPNTDDAFNVGVASTTRWQHGYFSGYLTTAGNIGIGLDTPSQKLEVVGKASIYPSGTTPNHGYNGNLVITKPAASGQYINLVREGSAFWSIGTKYNDTSFAIGTSQGTDSSFTAPEIELTNASGGTLILGGGTGKLTVGTVDPVYSIGGKQYATYVAGMIGQKEELTGTLKLEDKEYVIDFNNQEEGSDFWLFAEITNLKDNFDSLAVLLTSSFNGDVWYEKDLDKMTLTIYGDKDGEVSYRLTAPRYDHIDLPTKLEESDVEGLFIR